MKKYIATFGANQINEGYYLAIYANKYEDAVNYMEDRYSRNYCMVYNETQWNEWVEQANKIGFSIEKELAVVEVDYHK